MMSLGKLQDFYRETLTPHLKEYEHMKIERIIKDVYLLSDGNIQEAVDIVFEYTGDGELNTFPWFIPKTSSDIKICGIRIRVRDDTKSYALSENDSLITINIKLHNIKKGDVVKVKFEYYLLGICELTNGFFFDKIYFPMAFVGPNNVGADFRINVPADARVKFDTNFSEYPSVIDAYNYDRQILIASKEQTKGDFSGTLTLKYKSRYFRPFWTFILGIVSSVPIGLMQQIYSLVGNWSYLGIPVLLSGVIYMVYLIFRK